MEFLSTLDDAQEIKSGLLLSKPDRKFVPSYIGALQEGMKPSRHKTAKEEIEALKNNPDAFKLFSETCPNSIGTDNYCQEDMFWLTKGDVFIGYIILRHDMASQRQKYGGNTGREFRPSERNKGYGTTALKMTKLIAENRSYPYLEMVTASDNIAAIRPWQKCGGIEIEIIENPPESYHYSGSAVKYKIEFKGDTQ